MTWIFTHFTSITTPSQSRLTVCIYYISFKYAHSFLKMYFSKAVAKNNDACNYFIIFILIFFFFMLFLAFAVTAVGCQPDAPRTTSTCVLLWHMSTILYANLICLKQMERTSTRDSLSQLIYVNLNILYIFPSPLTLAFAASCYRSSTQLWETWCLLANHCWCGSQKCCGRQCKLCLRYVWLFFVFVVVVFCSRFW